MVSFHAQTDHKLGDLKTASFGWFLHTHKGRWGRWGR